MKRLIFSAFGFFSLMIVQAQWTTSSGVVSTNSNVGIGTNTPASKLDINSTASGRMIRVYGTNLDLDFFMGNSDFRYGFYWRYKGTQSGNNNDMEFWSNNQLGPDRLVYKVKQDGSTYYQQNIGIGTETLGSHRLAVEGSIGAREIIVEGNGWSDFVFEKEYNLPTLEEVEQHINQFGHLKDVPSAKSIEENGIPLGEMDARLLQKIEELTLYVLDINKQNKAQQKEIDALKQENARLHSLLATDKK